MPNLRFWLVLALTFIFNFCFWEEKLGLNTLLFSPLFLAALCWQFPESRRSYSFWITGGGLLIAAAMVTWHNSGAAKLAWMVSLACAAGFAQQQQLRYVLYAFYHYMQSALLMPKHFFASFGSRSVQKGNRSGRSMGSWLSLSFLPLLVVSVFYLLYYAANEKFAALSDDFWGSIADLFHFDISFGHILFILFALFICGGALWSNASRFLALDHKTPDTLTHQRPIKSRNAGRFALAGLRREFQQQQILLWMLNALLLVVNVTDLRYIWFGFDEAVQKDLKSYVHEGSYYLIASILFAMGVLFYVFRRNLNFYPNARLLRTAAAVWLAQNAVLALSVGVRNARYIDFHGLAYKRIGVFLFLILVFFGLLTLWRKINNKKSMHWLWIQSGWAFYILLIINACVNWDVWITEYNLSGKPRSTIDLHHIIYNLSDKNLYLLEQHQAELLSFAHYPPINESGINEGIAAKRRDFENKQSILSWKSWNGADAKNKKE